MTAQNHSQSARYYDSQRNKQTLFFGIALTIVSSTIVAKPGIADVIPNGLGTVVDVQGCTISCFVTGGSTRGTNLFHSFEEFSVPVSGTATFQHDEAIANIITRVTGGSASRINGTIQTLLDGSTDDVGTADLFFINPSGIVFGANAQLNIGGSFIGSTAEGIQFDDGTEFAVDVADPLLTISVPVGLQFGRDPGNIRVAGGGNNIFLNPDSTINRSDRPTGLGVPSGNTLALVGGTVNLNGGNLTADAGRIELGGIGNNSLVTLDETNRGWVLDYSAVETFGNIQLSNAASADVSGDDAGTLKLQGRNITLQEGSTLLANTLVSGGGTIALNATESLQLIGTSATVPAEPFTPLPTSAYIEISTGATGDGSSELTIATTDLALRDGAQIGLSMAGLGSSGVVTVEADTIVAERDAPTAFSGLFAAVLPVFPGPDDPFPPSLGTGGDLVINTNTLQVKDGAQILVNTFGIGDAGNLTITAQDIEVSGFSDFGASSLQAASEFPPTGQGGQITINTGRLSVTNGGQIATSTASASQPAGDIIIQATDFVELQGTAPPGRSGLFATAVSLINPETGEVAESFGEGGNIVIETPKLTVRDGATINVGNKPSNPDSPVIAPGNGPAGNLTVMADLIQLDAGAVVTANTVDGDRANILLQADLITLLDESQLTTDATGAATGGNLIINASAVVGFDNSDITANAVDNFGGRITVTANGVFGTQFREQLTPLSDITATSALGPQFNGVVELNTPDVDPSRGTAELPSGLLDPDTQVIAACEQTTTSSLLILGRGGLPQSANQIIYGQTLWQDFRWVDNQDYQDESGQISQAQSPPLFQANRLETNAQNVVEAQHWVIDSQGQINLISQAHTPVIDIDKHQHGCR
ncbi:MAG: filamentous hemagglutinin N-terminal domain-containing protein [Merismopedia sp. SIO2A8]|nr:filamentous hemagglutinin N-terminal domain-containing protein [Merismopedia sp. SIO2A8]